MTVATTLEPKIAIIPAEERKILYNITWKRYEKIVLDLGDNRATRITYDSGTLEITMPPEEHERYAELIGIFIRNLIFELGLKIKTMGSTTLSYSELEKSAEPDKCYYIQNQPKVARKKVSLKTDPPPDIVVEVDITHTNMDKPRIYSAMGVPELWRYNGEILRIYQLRNGKYIEVENSPTFPIWVKKNKLYEFIEACGIDEMEAERNLRRWLQEMITGSLG
ncbi:MAG: Uma2 family endonuclease [Leptospiraceae bacterium]|nr:Uma2 family endonuclease [Leptospiraceae bacterium]MCP5496827.1 Uma2 family endonuclease [Leptospiraceae bacterium]